MKKNKILVVGCGLSSIVVANMLTTNGVVGGGGQYDILLIDKRNHIGGNCYDYKKKNILIHKYGAHIFHTNYDDVWNYLQQFTAFNTYFHKVIAYIDGIRTTIPFNLNTLYDVFPKSLAERLEIKLLDTFSYNSKVPILELRKTDDKDLQFLADYVYKKVFEDYTMKQWGSKLEQLDKSVGERVPFFISKDVRYFQDKYQGIPIKGYIKMFENMLNHKSIKVKLNCDFKNVNTDDFDKIIYTGSIDEFFNYKFGVLPYRAVYFKDEYIKNPDCKNGTAVTNYPCNYDFTRIIEHKFFQQERPKHTIISKEYSTDFEIGKNERFYPIINPENIELYNKYLSLKPNNVYFLGRLGQYKYLNMDEVIKNAMELSKKIMENL